MTLDAMGFILFCVLSMVTTLVVIVGAALLKEWWINRSNSGEDDS